LKEEGYQRRRKEGGYHNEGGVYGSKKGLVQNVWQ
jgi:hypothetical protein